MRQLACCALAIAATGCTPAAGGGDAAVPDLSTAQATPEQLSLLADGAQGMTALRQSIQVADSLFNFDPTLAPDGSEQSNMMAVQMETMKNLAGCGSATLTGAGDGGAGGTLIVDFGSAPGCTVKGVLVSGQAALTLTVDKVNGITVSLLFTKLVAGAVSLDGALTFNTKNATTFHVVAQSFTAGAIAIDADIMVVGALLKATIDGTAMVTAGGVTRGLTFLGIVVHPGGCYATDGSLTVSTLPLTVVATFTASTPQTGIVDAIFSSPLGMVSGPYQLPPYGSCGPGAAKDGGG